MIRDRRPDTDVEKEAEVEADTEIEQPLTESTESTESSDTETGAHHPREDEERLKENREQLGVEEDHKTPDMRKGHRGTFP